MREILFRGKRVDNGQWVEGDLLRAESYLDNIEFTFIFTDAVSFPANEFIGYVEVDPSTVGQYTGLTDRNGVKIFEGDVVGQNWYDYEEPRDDSFGEVVFCEYDCSLSVMDIEKDGIVPLGKCDAYHWEVEVIGNIHDNPELLEQEGAK